MKKILFLFILLVEMNDLICQNPNYVYKQIEHVSNGSTIQILDAIFIVNDDTISFERTTGGYVLGYAISREDFKGKKNVTIIHPNYRVLKLDSVLLSERFYLFKNEPSYLSNGVPKPFINGLKNISIKYIATEEYDFKKLVKQVNSICKKHNLEISRNFKTEIDELEKQYNEDASVWAFGCLKNELIYTFWLKKKDDTDFDIADKMYAKIRNAKNIEWLAIPFNYYSNITNGFTISFKNETNITEIEELIEKYHLNLEFKNSSNFQNNYTFSVSTIIPNRTLMLELMYSPIVLSVVPKTIIYETCD